jgi:hypothetical protein
VENLDLKALGVLLTAAPTLVPQIRLPKKMTLL